MSGMDQIPSVGAPLEDMPERAWKPTLRDWLRYRKRMLDRSRLWEEVRWRAELRADRAELADLRGGRDVVWQDGPDPLVSVRIATYSAKGKLARAVESALAQTYRPVEVLVVGDCCDDETAAIAQRYAGDGVRFVNLPRRGQYPTDPRQRWMVAGATPMNVALELVRGSWIAPCDDDDVLTRDHVEVLLEHAKSHRLEFVWSRAAMQYPDGSWRQTRSGPLRYGQISHGSVLYPVELRYLGHNRRAHLLGIPADWEMWRRFSAVGVRMGFLDRITYYHFVGNTAGAHMTP